MTQTQLISKIICGSLKVEALVAGISVAIQQFELKDDFQ